MTQFQQKGFEVVKGFIPPFFSAYLRNYFTLRVQNEGLGGDSQAPNSHCVYGDPAFDMVMAMSTQDIGKIVGKNLVPQYTYARIYKNGSVLERHSDRPECQYSITLCLGGEYDKQWPIWIQDYDGNDHCVGLDEGDMVVYHGTELEHWREKFEGNMQYQLFMHYVDTEGEFKDRVYDGRPNLGLKKMIPQLIRELYDGKEWAACRELAIAYLRHEKSNEILMLLGGVYNEEKKFDKALECIEILNSNEPDILVNKARCLYYLNRAPEAERIIRSLPYKYRSSEAGIIDLGLYMNAQGKERETAELIAPLADTNIRAAFNYGWHLMAEDKLLEGYKYVRVGARDELRVWGHEWILRKDYNIGEEYRWNGETVDTIAFYLEGGMGDGMIFVRYAEQFQQYCKTVKIFAPEQIKPLLEECGYENVYVPGDIVKTKWDKYVPAMSAPYFLGLDDPMKNVTFPYFKRESKPVSEMNVIAQGKRKICIRWMGNPEFEHEQFRTVPLEKLLGLSKFGQLFSVQLEQGHIPKNANVWDLAPIIKSWSDTYDIFEESDLLITSCTATAHLAGAMGARVIVLPPINPYITWNTKDLRWYPDNVVVLRQMEYNNWDKTIDKLYEIMENWEW